MGIANLRIVAMVAGTMVVGAALAAGPMNGLRKSGRAISFSKDIAPIVQKNCVECHRPGEVAPFSLTSFEEVRKHSGEISVAVKSRVMPPWKANSHGEFLDERRLSAAEIDTITEWTKQGSPAGDGAAVRINVPVNTGWKLGKPDVIAKLSEPYKVSAEGRDDYRCFVIPSGQTEDRYVSAIEVHPGNRSVVHHVIAYLDASGEARKRDEAEPGPGYTSHGGGPGFIPSGFLGGWAPGNLPRRFPLGVGNPLPAKSDIVLEVHYHKNGKPEIDQTEVGVYFSKEPISKRVRVAPLINPLFRIPAGAADHEVKALLPVPVDLTVISLMPHMHLLGRTMRVTSLAADGSTKTMIDVPDWDFNWQNTYAYKEPVKLAAGGRLQLVARYDNSTGNIRNPNNPPKAVRWGEQTTDEMCLCFVWFTIDSEDLLKGNAASIGRGGLGGLRRLGRGE